MNILMDNLRNDNREPSSFLEGGFSCLIVAARVLGLPADYEQLVRAYPAGNYPDLALLRAAKGLSMKAKKTTGDKEDICQRRV